MNIGAIWGLIFAAIFIFVIYKKLKKKTEKEVKVINVARPKETKLTRDESTIAESEPRADKRISGKKPKGKSKKSRGVSDNASSADDRNKKRAESDSPAIPSVEPFEG